MRISHYEVQKYVNGALAPVVGQTKSTKLTKKFCIKSVTELLFDILAGLDVQVAECKIKSFN